MTAAAAPVGVTTRTFTAPAAPGGDPGVLHAYAEALRSLAAAFRRAAADLAPALPPSWQGPSATAAQRTAERLSAELRQAACAVEETAAELDRYALALQAARRHHHSWLSRVAKVAGVVVVTAAAVTITVATVGAAAPVAAAVAIEAEAGAGLAAGSAGAAETVAASAAAGMSAASATAAAAEARLLTALAVRTLPALRGLAAFVRPQLVGAEVFTGTGTSARVLQTGSLDPAAILIELTENVVVGGGIGALADRAAGSGGVLARLGRALGDVGPGPGGAPALLRHLGGGLTMGGIAAGEDELATGRVGAGDVATGFAQGLGGSLTGDAAAAHDVRVARRLAAARTTRLPRLELDPDGRLGALPGAAVLRADPAWIRFSQRSLSRYELRRAALSGGWDGPPIDVVPMVDGRLTALDNRRLEVARSMGLQVQIRVLDPDAVVPSALLASRFGNYRLPAGSTWHQVVEARIRAQGGAWSRENPLGSMASPPRIAAGPARVTGVRPPRVVGQPS